MHLGLIDGARHVAAHSEQLGVPARTVPIDKVERFALDRRDEARGQMTGERGGLVRAEPDKHAALCIQLRCESVKEHADVLVYAVRRGLGERHGVDVVSTHVHDVQGHGRWKALFRAPLQFARERGRCMDANVS